MKKRREKIKFYEILLLVIFYYKSVFADLPFAGPYWVEIKMLDYCDGNSKNLPLTSSNLKMKRISRTHVLFDGHVIVPRDIDDNFTGLGEVSKFGNGGWKPGLYRLEVPNICTYGLKNGRQAMNFFLSAIHQPPDKCPFKKGQYDVKQKLKSRFALKEYPVMPYGRFRIKAKLLLKKKVYGCILIEVENVPK